MFNIVQVLDKWNKVVAERRVLISEANRCFCIWKCECSCTSFEYQSLDSTCKMITKEEYNGAGFRGVLSPISNHDAKMNIVHLTSIFMATYWIKVFLTGTRRTT